MNNGIIAFSDRLLKNPGQDPVCSNHLKPFIFSDCVLEGHVCRPEYEALIHIRYLNFDGTPTLRNKS